MPMVQVPELHLSTPANGSQGRSWRRKASQTKTIRSLVYWSLKSECPRPPGLPVRFTLIRQAPRPLDEGNYQAAFKPVQDGVADWLAGQYLQGQDRQAGLSWAYTQQAGRSAVWIIWD